MDPHNPHSDLQLLYKAKGPDGAQLPLYRLPFTLTFRGGGTDRYTVMHNVNPEKWCGCSPLGTDTIRVTIPGGALDCGNLVAELHVTLDDGNTQCVKSNLGIPLSYNAPTVKGPVEVDVVVPYAVVSAYDMARAAGFAGTAEEYYAGLALLPALSAATTDLAAAKAEVAAALRLHGVDAADTDSLHSMADKVAHLPLAVPGEEGVVSHGWRGLGVPDLLNALRNNTRPADYPYMWAAATPQQEVPLAGADAYLCSDGYSTTEQGVTHTFTDPSRENWVIYYNRDRRYTVANTIGYVTGICVLSGTPSYSLADRTGYTTVGPVHSYTGDLPPDGEVSDINLDAPGITSIYLRGVRRVTGASHICNNAGILAGAVAMPDLEELDLVNGESWIRYGQTRVMDFPRLRRLAGAGLNNGSMPAHMCLPALERLDSGTIVNASNVLTSLWLPALELVVGGNVVYQSNALETLTLPALETVSGGTIASRVAGLEYLAFPRLKMLKAGYVVASAERLSELVLPALETISGGTLISDECPALQTLTLPALETFSSGCIQRVTNLKALRLPALTVFNSAIANGGMFWGMATNAHTSVYMPVVTEGGGTVFNGNGRVDGAVGHVYFGAQQSAVLYIKAGSSAEAHLHVAPGFRSTLANAYTFSGTTRDELLELIDNLADNAGHDTHRINLGADLLALLSDDEIALATAKNYTLS